MFSTRKPTAQMSRFQIALLSALSIIAICLALRLKTWIFFIRLVRFHFYVFSASSVKTYYGGCLSSVFQKKIQLLYILQKLRSIRELNPFRSDNQDRSQVAGTVASPTNLPQSKCPYLSFDQKRPSFQRIFLLEGKSPKMQNTKKARPNPWQSVGVGAARLHLFSDEENLFANSPFPFLFSLLPIIKYWHNSVMINLALFASIFENHFSNTITELVHSANLQRTSPKIHSTCTWKFEGSLSDLLPVPALGNVLLVPWRMLLLILGSFPKKPVGSIWAPPKMWLETLSQHLRKVAVNPETKLVTLPLKTHCGLSK